VKTAGAVSPFEETLEHLEQHPGEYRFYQAAWLLEAAASPAAAVGRFTEPAKEAVRFCVEPSLAFPPREVQKVDRSASPPRLTTPVLALTGPNGALPLVYTDFLEERQRARDYAARDFFDLFHHRLLSLYYRTWLKFQMPSSLETGAAGPFEGALASLAGLATPGLRDRLRVADLAVLFYSGLLGPQARSAIALESLIGDYFNVPVEVEPLSGGWYLLSEETACSLDEPDFGELGDSGTLGFGALVGQEYWDPNSCVRIRLGPLSAQQYRRFLPGSPEFRELRELTRFFARGEVDFVVQLVLEREHVGACVLGDDSPAATQLGWTTWMKSGPRFDRDPDDTTIELEREEIALA
jgi:type VI secretion system protein ImpH